MLLIWQNTIICKILCIDLNSVMFLFFFIVFCIKVRVVGADTGSKIVAHEGMGSGTSIFYKREYGDGHYSTLPIGGPCHPLCR